MTKCPANYKNLGCESFGEQKYVTAEMLRQFCMNDEYLYQQLLELWKWTSPVTRKRFNPIPLDETKSFGVTQSTSGIINFDKARNCLTHINFSRYNAAGTADSEGTVYEGENLIDVGKSDTIIYSKKQGNDIQKEVTIPKTLATKTDKTTRDYSPFTVFETDAAGDIIYDDEGYPKIISDSLLCNEYWYVGFDRNRHYETRPNWLNNQLNGEIPGVTRAQTFKARSSGVLEEVTLNIHCTSNTAMPLVVQIRRTEMVNGVYQPVNSDEPHLAYQEVRFTTTDPGVVSIHFDHPAIVEKDQTYAIVLLSPLSHPSNCYWVGGWNRACKAEIYSEGDAFLSENCGYTWMRYGKDDSSLAYHQGSKAPQDFGFICHITSTEEKYDTTKDYYCYFKPFLTSPVKTFALTSVNDNQASSTSVTYELWTGNEWTTLADNTYTFPEGQRRQETLFRAKLKSLDGVSAPAIYALGVVIEQEAPLKAYARTQYYTPARFGTILGANVWGRINAPYILEPNVTASVEIIRNQIAIENFDIIKNTGIYRYQFLTDTEIPVPTDSSSTAAYEAKMQTFCEQNPDVLDTLANNDVYVVGYFMDIKFNNQPASNILSCNYSKADGTVEYLAEYHDYTVDYETAVLTFYNECTSEGRISIEYNPCFIKDLNGSMVYDGTSYVTGGDMPFALDYMTEDITVTDNDLENGYVELKTYALDPMRSITLNPDTSSEESLIEDEDYTVDYNNHRINIPVANYKTGDKLHIEYTPDLDDTGIAIGYKLSRTNTDNQVTIEKNWIEYKT